MPLFGASPASQSRKPLLDGLPRNIDEQDVNTSKRPKLGVPAILSRRCKVPSAVFIGMSLLLSPGVLLGYFPKTAFQPSHKYDVSHSRNRSLVSVSGELSPNRAWMPFFRRRDIFGQPDKPRILFWTTISGDFRGGLTKNRIAELRYWGPSTDCAYHCYIANDRQTLAISDAVVFYISDIMAYDLPFQRALGQKWVFYSKEAPSNWSPPSVFTNNMAINWTMTYRQDSDVWVPYATVTPMKKAASYSFDGLRKVWTRKKTMAVWPVSHCGTHGNREGFVQELRRHIQVDIYGGCGNYSCSRGAQCHLKFAGEYFFFLAFENTLCDEYVTEKLYFTLLFDIIPVTFGGANYQALAPPGCHIDALKFKTPKHLADYLKLVSENFELYKGYFLWKGNYDVKPLEDYNFCTLCAKLYSPSFRESSVYPDLVQWWQNNSSCRAWDPNLG